MKKSFMLGLIALAAMSSVYGQTRPVKAMIDFPFIVEGKTLPAGTYEFVLEETGDLFRIMGEGTTVLANVVTRRGGEMRSAPKGTHLVFDKVGNNYMLSEIWVPAADGYLVLASRGAHEHKTVDLMKYTTYTNG
jgi:hypothetical protein